MLCTFRKLDDVIIDPMVDGGLYREMIEFFAGWVAAELLCKVKPRGQFILPLISSLKALHMTT
ncbi:MAG: hypothetical protein ACYC1M_19475, partial [Armatimonadota bacterium]